jgi:hypothetical protein
MRPVGNRQLPRYEVAQVVAEESIAILGAHLINLLAPTAPSSGGSGNVGFVPEPGGDGPIRGAA